MTSKELPQQSQVSSSRGVLSACVGLVILMALIAASYFYPYPSGKRPELLNLFMFWGREAVIVASVLVLLVMLAVGVIVKAAKNRNAPDA